MQIHADVYRGPIPEKGLPDKQEGTAKAEMGIKNDANQEKEVSHNGEGELCRIECEDFLLEARPWKGPNLRLPLGLRKSFKEGKKESQLSGVKNSCC